MDAKPAERARVEPSQGKLPKFGSKAVKDTSKTSGNAVLDTIQQAAKRTLLILGRESFSREKVLLYMNVESSIRR